MSFVAISDVHIKDPGDNQEKLFLDFLASQPVKEASEIYLLGDIFDLLVGSHEGYLKKFGDVFESLSDEVKKGKKIIQFEGNHDFHYGKLIKLIKKKWSLPNESWVYRERPLVREYNGMKILFAHGDEIEIENPRYQKYRKLIRSKPIYFLANYIVPFEIVDRIGRSASEKSRRHNMASYSDNQADKLIKDRFRRTYLEAKNNYNVDSLICGHSHCLDLFKTDDGVYSNNGFFPKTKTITTFKDGEISHYVL